jgi:hypothetical protein
MSGGMRTSVTTTSGGAARTAATSASASATARTWRPALARMPTTTVQWLTLGMIALTCVSLALAAALATGVAMLRDAQPSAAAAVE